MARTDPPRDVGAGAWVEWALVCAVPIALLATLTAYLVGRYFADREIVRAGRQAVAVVTEREVRPDRRGRPVDFARLAWTVDDRRWRGWFSLPRAVDHTRVVYAPSWPGRAVIAGGPPPREPSPLGVLIPLAFFGAGLWAPVGAMHQRRVTKARRLLREGVAAPGEVTSWTLDRATVVSDGKEGAWRFPPWLAAPMAPGAASTVLRDPGDESVAAPVEALRPTLVAGRVAALAAADVAALVAFGWVYLRDLFP